MAGRVGRQRVVPARQNRLACGDHSIIAWRHDSTNTPGDDGWISRGRFAQPTASVNEKTTFANLTCDRKADYVLRDPTESNQLISWANADGLASLWGTSRPVAGR